MDNTCSRPPAELLKMRTFPDCTTYRPAQGSPSPKVSSPAAYLRCKRCEVRKANSCSVKLEKMGSRFSTASEAASCSVGMATILRDAIGFRLGSAGERNVYRVLS